VQPAPDGEPAVSEWFRSVCSSLANDAEEQKAIGRSWQNVEWMNRMIRVEQWLSPVVAAAAAAAVAAVAATAVGGCNVRRRRRWPQILNRPRHSPCHWTEF